MTSLETLAPARRLPRTVAPPEVAFSLQTGEPAWPGLRRILTQQVELGAWHLDRASDSDTHVHEVRKATKRIRAVLRMARDDIDAVDYRCLNVEVRELARVLSGVRTAVVQVDLLESLVTDDRDLRAGTRGLHRDVVAEADRQRRAVNVRTLRELSLRLSVVRSEVEHLPLPDVDRVPAGGISKTFRRGRRAMKSAYATPTITKFHIWRKQVKYLRHQMEILEAGGGQSLSALVSDLEQIGEGLGMDHDLADLERAARGTASDVLSPTDRRHLAEAISKRRDELEHGMKPIAARVYGANPASFAEQVTRRPG